MMKKLWLWLLFLVGVNLVWLTIDKTPPAWDQAAHLRSVILVNQFLRGIFWGNLVDLIKSFGGYPPLIYVIGGLWSLVLGTSVAAVTAMNSVFLVLAIVGVWMLGGFWPAVIFSLFPVVYDISRNFLLDLPLTVFVIWGLYFWLKKNDWRWLLMLVLASLTKLNGFIYFAPMVLISLIQNFKSKELWMKLVIAGAIYMLAVGWWWGINWQNIYQYLTGLAGQGEKLTDPMDLSNWVTWIHYFRLFFLNQAGPVLAIACVISWFKIERNPKNRDLMWWVILVYVIFTIIRNKDFRFTMPILPVLALWLGESIKKAKNKMAVGVLFMYLLFNYWENSFGWPIKKPVIVSTPTFLMGDVNWINFADYPVRAASSTVWPNKEIVKEMMAFNGGKKSKVLVLTDSAEINDNNMKFYRETLSSKEDQILEMHSIYEPNFSDWKSYNAVLLMDKVTEPAPFYATNLEDLKQARDYVWDNPDKFSLIKEFNLPNQQNLYLMKVM